MSHIASPVASAAENGGKRPPLSPSHPHPHPHPHSHDFSLPISFSCSLCGGVAVQGLGSGFRFRVSDFGLRVLGFMKRYLRAGA